MIKVNQEAEYIFKYQRYTTVLDFASRAALPPPLSVVGYLFDWVVTCCIKVRKRGGDHTRLVNLTRPRSGQTDGPWKWRRSVQWILQLLDGPD